MVQVKILLLTFFCFWNKSYLEVIISLNPLFSLNFYAHYLYTSVGSCRWLSTTSAFSKIVMH